MMKAAVLHSGASSSCYSSMDSELPRIHDVGGHVTSTSTVSGRANSKCRENDSASGSFIETDTQTIVSMTSLSQQTTSSAKGAKGMVNGKRTNIVSKSNVIVPKLETGSYKRLRFLSDLLDEPRTAPMNYIKTAGRDTNNNNKARPKTAGTYARERVQLPQRPNTAILSDRRGKRAVEPSSTLLELKSARDDINRLAREAREKIKNESISRRLPKQDNNQSAKRSGSANIKFRTSLSAEQKVAWLHVRREQEANLIVERNARKHRLRTMYWTAQWKVLWILRWLKIMVKHSIQITPKTATEMQYHQLNNSIEARELAFNKSIYDRERIHTRLAPWAITILTKDPLERTESDCRRLHALLRGLKSFDKFTERIQLAMCQSFQYMYVQTDRVILRKGHIGFNFYFIFSGSVFVDVEERDNAGNTFLQTDAILSRGTSFGELALLKDITRQANIRCREPCELLVVEKEVFSNVCPRIFDKELEDKVDFISNLPLFQTKWWTDDSLQSICFEAQIQEYKTGKLIVTDSAHDDWIYICMEGRCTIYKQLELESELVANADRRRSMFQRDVTVESQQDITQRDGRDKPMMAEQKEQKEKHKLDKTRLLNSMALDWMDVHEKLKEVVNIHEEEDAVKTAKKSIENKHKPKREEQETPCGVTSFTAFIKEKKAQADGKELVFLSIGTLGLTQVFDLFAIVRNHTGSTALMLVSSGARLLRIKRTRFFGCAAQEAIKHAKMISNKDEYKTDGELLFSYEVKNKWDGFKQTVVDQVIEPHIEQARRQYLCNYLQGKQADKKRQAEKLMSVLRKNKKRHNIELQIKEMREKEEKQAKAKQSVVVFEDEEDRKIRILTAVNNKAEKGKQSANENSQRWTVPVT